MKTKGAIEILEEAVNLLRGAPPQVALCYFLGAVPFTLGLLFFLSDMTRSPFASEHVAIASLGVAILFVWKCIWQGVFVERLHRSLSAGSAPGNRLRMVLIQAALQPVGLLLKLPFPWLEAFFRNTALFAALGTPHPLRTARKQAVLWTGQNWGVLTIVSLAGLLLFGNLVVLIAILPGLARSILGIEGDFARAGAHILNMTTVGVALAGTWLAVDPLLDAVYVLRCFYGESRATGEDLLAACRKAIAAIVVLIAIFSAVPRPALADPPPASHPSVDSGRLDRSIDEVIHRREFTWRAPRPAGEEPHGRWVGWIRAAEDAIAGFWNWLGDKVRDWFQPNPERETEAAGSPVTPLMLKSLIGIVVALVTGAIVFWLRRRRAPAIAAQAVAIAPSVVDLADESVTADQMHESSWMKLAEDLLAKGDYRLALRAMHLAGLNYLAERGLISIRRWKSGLDYRRELERRTRSDPRMAPAFHRNIAIFERGWYGRYTVDRETVESFAAGLKELRSYGN